MNVTAFSSEKDFIRESIFFIRSTFGDSYCSIALSGGRTPETLYRALAKESNIPWERIDVWQVDERCVPKDHPDSNRRLIEGSFSPITHRLSGWHFFDTSLPIDDALSRYELSLRETSAFDLVILGMGTDGHIASLFSHSKALHETTRLVAHTTTDHGIIRDRLSLTFPAILASKKILLLLSGEEKKPAFEELLYSKKTTDEFPAKKLLGHPELSIFTRWGS